MKTCELSKKLSRFGSRPGLERIAKIMERLGHPEKEMKVILVTGTNGKGSVTNYLSSILKEAGYRTGSYFSPHLVEWNERICIDGKQIADATFKKYERILLDLLDDGFEMTEFEALTAMAYKYFADEKCDFAVMEIGMGGKLDATNIAEEAVSVITNVDLEHTEYLGSTASEIAEEKAGVMKKGVCITGADGIALEIIKQISNRRGIELRVLNENIFAKPVEINIKHGTFNYVGHEYINGLEVMLLGRHQIDNAALAVAVAEELGIDQETIKKGLKKATNDGRLQMLKNEPKVIIDGAHNVHGIKELVANLNLFDYERIVLVFGVMKDKNWKEMLKLLGPHCDLIVASEVTNERSKKSKDVAKEAEKYAKTIDGGKIGDAYAVAKQNAGKKDLILVCGSLYLLGEFFEVIKRKSK
ncbi:MAG: folylpolyglutamate synthase/dihydrofolate synthase family protein [Candidatus Micrarchaeia archaeon]|jgi:dihydrofolate synthase/folylpolyglutamate synthase